MNMQILLQGVVNILKNEVSVKEDIALHSVLKV